MDSSARSAGLGDSTAMRNRLPALDVRRGVRTPSVSEAASLNVELSPRGTHARLAATEEALHGDVDMTVVRTPRGTMHMRAMSRAVMESLASGSHPLPPSNLPADAPEATPPPGTGMGHINTSASGEVILAAGSARFDHGSLESLSADSGHFNNLTGSRGRARTALASRIASNSRALGSMLAPTAVPGARVQYTAFGERGAHLSRRNFMSLARLRRGIEARSAASGSGDSGAGPSASSSGRAPRRSRPAPPPAIDDRTASRAVRVQRSTAPALTTGQRARRAATAALAAGRAQGPGPRVTRGTGAVAGSGSGAVRALRPAVLNLQLPPIGSSAITGSGTRRGR